MYNCITRVYSALSLFVLLGKRFGYLGAFRCVFILVTSLRSLGKWAVGNGVGWGTSAKRQRASELTSTLTTYLTLYANLVLSTQDKHHVSWAASQSYTAAAYFDLATASLQEYAATHSHQTDYLGLKNSTECSSSFGDFLLLQCPPPAPPSPGGLFQRRLCQLQSLRAYQQICMRHFYSF